VLLSAKGISKSYTGVRALNLVDFELKKGEVHALVGENGAGKSTLIKIITGIVEKDEGEIKVDGVIRDIKNPHFARSLGISTIFQELSQIPGLNVSENVFLGHENSKFKVFLDRKAMSKKTKNLIDKYNINLNPDAILLNLSAAQRQLAEIIKAVSSDPRILIMDEPTSSLTVDEAENLFKIIDDLKKRNSGIIYISHRMDEIFRIADRISVLRDGNLVACVKASDVDMDGIVKLMVGREIEIYQGPKKDLEVESTGREPVLEIKNVSRKGVFSDISFTLYRGEILGIAGLVGSGRSELVRSIFGVDKIDSGEIFLNNSNVKIKSVRDALNFGIALLPESRHFQGLVLKHTVEQNVILPILKRFSFLGLLNYKKTDKFVKEKVKEFDIRTNSINTIVENLSGGNQQKVVITKWLSTNPQILIVDEPTIGIDVKTKSEIHKIIRNLADKGISIIMISSELSELLPHSDRIMVMNKGHNLGIFNHTEITQEKIMSLIMQDIIKTKN
jgi:ribose transport system ATP-binding protein